MKDRYGRIIDYMRISITDRCNLRCRYCMPEGISKIPMEHILTYEEIEQICRAASELGICKLKITGGEPLVRLGCPELIGRLKQIPGIKQVTLTTNGVSLKEHLPELLEHGLDAVNISLDTLKPRVYQQITGKDKLYHVLSGVEETVKAGLSTKINVVLQPSVNDAEWLELARLTNIFPIDVRFIEMMPIGYGRTYQTVSNQELMSRFLEVYPNLQRDQNTHGNGPAVYYRTPEAKGSVGFISAIHGKFCQGCNRLRLTSQGKLKPCLCFEDQVDLMEALRGSDSLIRERRFRECKSTISKRWQEESESVVRKKLLQQRILQAVGQKPQEHNFEQTEHITERRQMVQIGG